VPMILVTHRVLESRIIEAIAALEALDDWSAMSYAFASNSSINSELEAASWKLEAALLQASSFKLQAQTEGLKKCATSVPAARRPR